MICPLLVEVRRSRANTIANTQTKPPPAKSPRMSLSLDISDLGDLLVHTDSRLPDQVTCGQ